MPSGGSGIVVNLPGSPVQTSARRLLALQLATAEVVVEFTAASGKRKKITSILNESLTTDVNTCRSRARGVPAEDLRTRAGPRLGRVAGTMSRSPRM